MSDWLHDSDSDASVSDFVSVSFTSSFSAASVNSSDSTIVSLSDLDPLAKLQEGLDEMEEILDGGK